MNEELNEKKLETVTGGGIDIPSYPPVKYRCPKCGYELMADGAIQPKSLHCVRCKEPMVKVKDE